MPREMLYGRINARVDKMMELGLVDEVRGLMDKGLAEALTSKQAIGYKEIVAALKGETSMDDAVEDIKRASRRYAKRQYTWFNADKRIHWFDVSTLTSDELLKQVVAMFACADEDHWRRQPDRLNQEDCF